MEPSDRPDVAFIGLGAMGFGMATHLCSQGFAVTGFDVWPQTLARFAAFGATTTTLAAAVAGKAVCVCMVATAQQAQAVLVGGGSDGAGNDTSSAAAAALPLGAVILLCATVPASYVQALAHQLADPAGPVRRPDLLLIDCPVSGGAARAADGTLSIMAGAGDAAFAHTGARTVLAALAAPNKLYRFGSCVGAGSNAKMVHQVLAASNILAASEAMALAARLRLQLGPGARVDFTPESDAEAPITAATLDALVTSPGRSWMLANRGPRMLTRFVPRASAVHIITKDTAIITAEARRTRFAAPMTAAVENVLYDAVVRGYGDDDDSALIKVYTGGGANSGASPSIDLSRSDAEQRQIVVGLLKGIHLAAAAESLAFSHHVGLDLDQVLNLCIHAAGGSAMLEAHGPAIVAALQNGKATTGWEAAASTAVSTTATADAVKDESLASIYEGLEAAIDIAQQLKAPVYLGTQAATLLLMALRSKNIVANAAAGSVVKVWLP